MDLLLFICNETDAVIKYLFFTRNNRRYWCCFLYFLFWKEEKRQLVIRRKVVSEFFAAAFQRWDLRSKHSLLYRKMQISGKIHPNTPSPNKTKANTQKKKHAKFFLNQPPLKKKYETKWNKIIMIINKLLYQIWMTHLTIPSDHLLLCTCLSQAFRQVPLSHEKLVINNSEGS